MPKRRNPYFDDFQPQIKIHVGVKEFNNTKEKMKAVYERTMGLLFEGANHNNNVASDIKDNNNTMNSRVTTTINNCNIKPLKQMFLGKNGTLKKEGTCQEQLVSSSSSVVSLCTLCKSQPADSWVNCSYCEVPQCSGCSLLCIQCNSYTCSNCSVESYGGQSRVCLSCCR